MKSKKIQLLEKILRLMAKAVLWRYRPTIVGVTGSVGKTSTKEAIFAVLSTKYRVRRNEKNYNNEIGIPLTVMGMETGGKSLFKWALNLLRWLYMLVLPTKYPEVLILEFGVDRPGDMGYLTSFIRPNVSVVTNISSSHIEFFKTLEGIAKEKRGLVDVLQEDEYAILNADDERVIRMGEKSKAKIISYGFNENAKVQASNVSYNYDQRSRPEGLSFRLNYDGKTLPIRLKNVLAPHQVNAALAGISVGIAMKINLVEAAQGLEKISLPLGRLNIVEGIKNSIIIDDTYNASPVSTVAALGVLRELRSSRKVAVLGDMLELGEETENGHRAVAKAALESGASLILLVGKRMKLAEEELKSRRSGEFEFELFDNPVDAGMRLRELAAPGDLILVKGSQGMRMEKVAEQVIADPLLTEEKICRQSKEWKEKPFLKP